MKKNRYAALTVTEKMELVAVGRAAVENYEYPARVIAEQWGIPQATAYSWIRHLEAEQYIAEGEVVKRRRPRPSRNGVQPEPAGPPVVTVGEPFVLVLPSGERLEMLMVEAVTADIVQ